MTRTARLHSDSNIYHIMLRGINRQVIFFERDDFLYFTFLLEKYKKTCGYKLYAYCLMDNHVHLLIYINEKTPEHIFRHLGSAFVYWYNGKYERTGHLFQDRYKSEAVSTDQYFISVLRYIIRNPVAAGICRTPDQYLYSSGAEYLLGTNGITDKNDVFQFMSPTMLRDFLLTENTDQCMDINEVPRKRLTDESAKNLILREFGTCSPAVGKPKERNSLYHSIRSLVSDGISIRQLSRLTGISKKIIEKGLKDI